MESADVILPHDKAKLRVGEAFFQFCKGIDRVGGRRKRKLYIASLCQRIVFGCKSHQFKTLFVLKQTCGSFEGIEPADNKPKSIDVSVFYHILGNYQMPYVNRIETSEIQSNGFTFLLHGFGKKGVLCQGLRKSECKWLQPKAFFSAFLPCGLKIIVSFADLNAKQR